MRRHLAPTLRVSGGLVAVGMAFWGAYLLDARQKAGWGYALLLLGSILLLLPVWDPDGPDRGEARPRIAALSAFAAAVGLTVWVTSSLFRQRSLTGSAQLLLWFAAGACVILGFHLLDRSRHPAPFPSLLEKPDWLWMAGLFAAGTAARLLNLAVQPPGLYADELGPLERTLRLMEKPYESGFLVDDLSMSGLFHHINILSIRYSGWLGLDLVQSAKLPGVLFAGLSIALTYAVVRILTTRPLAATAGFFLLWQGLHWTLSRFYYQYAGDLFWISLVTALLVAGLAAGRLSLVGGAGFAAGVAMSWLKASMMAGPWIAVLLLEDSLGKRAGAGRRFLMAGTCFSAFALAFLPPAAQWMKQPTMLWYVSDVSRTRAHEIERLHMTSLQAYLKGLLGVPKVLQVHENQGGRYPVRVGKPALDVITSVMATVGFVWGLAVCFRRRDARICLLGFLLFLWPAVGSFPAHADGAEDIVVSRRLAGSTLFLAWLAAYGSAAVARRVAPERWRNGVMLGIAGASMVLNAYYVRTTYGRQPELWYEGMGINRVYTVRALREAARVGPVFFRPTHYTEWVSSAVVDLPNVTFVKTVTEVRDGLKNNPGQMCVVLLPWPATVDPSDSTAWVKELSDVIPATSWIAGPPDLLGLPLYRIAYVRAPQRPLPERARSIP